MISKSAKLSTKLFKENIDMIPTRNGYGEGLLFLGESNKDVVVLSADLAESTRALAFGKKYPERFFEVGVAEQNMMGIAAGLALSGKIPFISSYATFSPGRNWDQLRVSVAYSQANVKIAGNHTGLSVGPDGATHQALEDIAITRVLPNLTVIQPCDYEQAKKCTVSAAEHKGPVYFRLVREKVPVFTTADTPFRIGKAQIFREGVDAAIVACGPLLYEALLAAKELSLDKLEVMVVNSHTIKPLDAETILKVARATGGIVTVEEHQITGGLGGAVAELLSRELPTPMEFIGMPDTFGESGKPIELQDKYGMLADDIVKAVKKVIAKKNRS